MVPPAPVSADDDRPPQRAGESRFDSPRQEAFLNLWRTYDRLRQLEDDLFDEWGLTAQQYNALRLLRARGAEPLTTLGLAGKLISKAPDITRLLDKLVERGLIVRRRLEGDRRVVEISITPDGLALLERLDEPVRQCHERQLGHLDDEQLARLTQLLRTARAPHEDPGNLWR
jgi:DNA-binding MarR family transcriptional regulator